MNKYEVIETIGEGAYGVVLKCRNKETGEFVAIKRFKESEEDELVKKTTLREVKVLRMLKHETYVVHLIEAFRRKGKLYLVFEYVGCNLLDILDSHPTGVELEEVRRMVFTMLLGIRACHANGVIHRDIKPENLLVHDDQTLRLCDFGFARPYTANMNDLTDYVATRWYRSPELLLGTTDYGLPSDLWAVGCIMAELLDGQALFPGESELDQLFLIQKLLGNFTPQQVEQFKNNKTFAGYALRDVNRPETSLERKFGRKAGKKATHFLKSVLVVDPAKRLTIDEALQHPFFEGLLEQFAPGMKLTAPPVMMRPSTGERHRVQPAAQAPIPQATTAQPPAPSPQLPTQQPHLQQQGVLPAAPGHYQPSTGVPPITANTSAHYPQQTAPTWSAPVDHGAGSHLQHQPAPEPTAHSYHPHHLAQPVQQPQMYQGQQYGAYAHGNSALPPTSSHQPPAGNYPVYGSQSYIPQPVHQPQPQPAPQPVPSSTSTRAGSFLPPRVGSGQRRAPQQWYSTAQPETNDYGANSSSGYAYGAQQGGAYTGAGLPRTHSRGDVRSSNLPKLHHGQVGGPTSTGGRLSGSGNGGMHHGGHSRLSSNASDASNQSNPYKPYSQTPASRTSQRMFQ